MFVAVSCGEFLYLSGMGGYRIYLVILLGGVIGLVIEYV